MPLDFLEPGLGLIPHYPDPSGGSVLQLGMILIFPRSLCHSQSFTLLATLDFVAGNLRQEGAPASLPDEFVDVRNHIER
jgi:hypothetical protein